MMQPFVTVLMSGEPVPKGRPRFLRKPIVTRTGKLKYAFTPPKTASYEAALGWAARIAMRGRPSLEGPVRVVVKAFFQFPKRFRQAEKIAAHAGILRPIHKFDWDNIGKIVGDALNEIVWVDDGQIVDGQVLKFYSDDPGMQIDVYLEGAAS